MFAAVDVKDNLAILLYTVQNVLQDIC